MNKNTNFVSCECGCGLKILKKKYSIVRRFVSGHNKRRLFNEFISCECGCGTTLLKYQKGSRSHRFVNGHNMIGNNPSKGTRLKLRLAQLGKKTGPLSEKHKQKIRTSMIGKKWTEEARESNRKSWTPERRQKQSEETRRRRNFVCKRNWKTERFIQSVLTLNRIDYERQKIIRIGKYYHAVDFFIKPNICIEADGCHFHACEKCLGEETIRYYKKHSEWKIRDIKLNKKLVDQNYLVFRFWEHEIYEDVKKCLDYIIRVNLLMNVLGLKKIHGLLQEWTPSTNIGNFDYLIPKQKIINKPNLL